MRSSRFQHRSGTCSTLRDAKLAQAQTNVEQAWAALFPTIAAQGKYTHNYKNVELGFMGPPLVLQPSEQLDGVVSITTPIIAPAAYPALSAVIHAPVTPEQAKELVPISK